MNVLLPNSRHPHSRHPQWVVGISTAILLGALALTSVADGLAVSVIPATVPDPDVRFTRIQRAMCEECGVVVTTRRNGRSDREERLTAVTPYEVTVRMRDGSIRTFTETSSVHWRAGERIILIGDARPSSK